MKTSEYLHIGGVYSRNDLVQEFGITDATINTGIFQPRGTSSIWLFITENKSTDRTQYVDKLEGNRLCWEGQSAGRKDRLIIEHVENDLEILVFYRRVKSQYPECAFKYEGPFRYVTHEQGNPQIKNPSKFILDRII